MRAAFIALTIGLPVFLITGLTTTDGQRSHETLLRAEMGTADAYVINQSNPSSPRELSALLGGAQLTPTSHGIVGVVNDGRWSDQDVLMADLTRGPARAMVFPISGRLPQRAGEVVVTPEVRRFLHGNEIQFRVNNRGYRAVVVGVVGAAQDMTTHPGTFPQVSPSSFLVTRSTPFSAAEIDGARRAGVDISSQEWGRYHYTSRSSTSPKDFWVVLVMMLGSFEIALLTAPAFTVGALRMRRSLAQLALNGADRQQVRRVVLGQAVTLGWVPAAAGALLGIIAGWAAAAWSAGRGSGLPIARHIDWPFLLLTLGCALAAAMAGALWPTRGNGRLEVINLLRHHPPQDRARRRTPIVALVCAGFLTMAQAYCMVRGWRVGSGSDDWVRISVLLTIAAVVSVMCAVPWVLSVLAARTRRGPVAMRIAARDALRQRSRSVSAVSAILGAFAVLGLLSVSMAKAWGPETAVSSGVPAGMTSLSGLSSEDDTVADQLVKGALDGKTIVPVYYLADGTYGTWAPYVDTGKSAASGSGGSDTEPLDLTVLRTQNVSQLPFTAAERAVLEAGGVVNVNPQWVRGGKIRVSTADQRWQIPAVATDGRSRLGLRMFATEKAAHVLGRPLKLSTYLVRGEISPQEAARLQHAFPDSFQLRQQLKQHQSDSTRWLLAASGLALFLAVFAAVSATVLSQAEQRRELRTMQVLGATAGLTRWISAAQAGMIAAIGAVLGLGIGLGPGVIYGMDLSGTKDKSVRSVFISRLLEAITSIPWGLLVLTSLLTTLLAAGIAWLLAGGQRELVSRRT